jgi:hypothetical protein
MRLVSLVFDRWLTVAARDVLVNADGRRLGVGFPPAKR